MKKKIVIVGSGPGLARQVARRFGHEGWQVVMMARNAKRLDEAAKTLKSQGAEAVTHVCDVSDFEKLDAMIRAESEKGGIDILNYNAATIRMNTPLLDLSTQDIASDLMIGLGGALIAARAAIPGMRDRRAGSIIFNGGELGFAPWHTLPTLGVVKAGMRNAIHALTQDPACKDIRLAYINIHAHIVGDVGNEIADVIWRFHHDPHYYINWDMKYFHPQ
jgi:NADP-dependent 3-hydroxy acid dehydrogenase YdfG